MTQEQRSSADVVVVGAGAAGGWAALTLAQAGLRVELVDAGQLVPQDGRVDRAAHEDTTQETQRLCSAYTPATGHLFVNDRDNPYEHPPERPFHWFRARQLGGRLLLWAGVCLRLSPRELEYGDPAGARWPLAYSDLVPHYEHVERFMRVTGGGEDSPAAPAPAALREEPLTQGEKRLAAAAGNWPHRQVLSARIAHRPAGALLGTALATGRLTLRPASVAVGLTPDRTGRRIASVTVARTHDGTRTEITARAVVLAASAVESVRLLLAGISRHHPDGIGNTAGLLGRGLLDHTAGIAVSGHVADCPPARPRTAPGFVPVVHVPDFSHAEGREGFAGGFGLTGFVPETVPASDGSRRWITDAREQHDAAAFRLWASGETLPCPDNRITLSSSRTDAWDMPAARLDYTLGPDQHAQAAAQARAMTELAEAAGFTITAADTALLPPGSSVHELGGAPMGRDPAVSVLDPDNRVWDVPNLRVVDGACFPRAGWQNPTLTIMALARRAAHILAGARPAAVDDA
ncbi:GMC oxidoreductase, partial [Streptomyces virginiae]